MGDPSCTREDIHNFQNFNYSDACSFVQAVCADQVQALDIIGFYYCGLNESIPLMIVLGALACFAIFHFLATTTENYLAPALSLVAEKFRFSEALAGVTLVALANGANDVIVAFAAGGSADPAGFYTALGSIFGANLFTTTVVFARCIYGAGGEIKANTFSTSRDMIFFIIASSYILIAGLFGKIPVPVAFGFFGVYALYFCFVIWAEYRLKKKERIAAEEEDEDKMRTVSYQVHKIEELNTSNNITEFLREHHYSTEGDRLSSAEIPNMKRKAPHSMVYRFNWLYSNTRHRLVLRYQGDQGWKNKTIIEKILAIYEFPIDLIRDFSIPCVNEATWNRRIAPCTPFFASIFIIWQVGAWDTFSDNAWAWAVVGIVDALLAFWIWKISHKHQIPRQILLLLCLIAFVSCVLWVNLVANAFQDVLFVIQVVTGLPTAYLGLTLLAWGNSANDFFVDYSLAKQGLGQMAVSGVFAGQLFNLLIGFGASISRAAMEHGTLTFELTDGTLINNLNLVILGSALINFSLQLAFTFYANSQYGKKYAKVVMVFYLVFFLCVTTFSFIQAASG